MLQSCAVAPTQAYQPYGAPGPQAAYPVPAPYPYYVPPQQQGGNDAAEVKERLERVEKAMLRLDRRMQLVENNELHRMSSAEAARVVSAYPSGPAEEWAAMRSLDIGPSAAPAARAGGKEGGFRQVSTAPEAPAAYHNAPPAADPGVLLASSNLPSLADPTPAKGQLATSAEAVAVWKVRYEAKNVWPDRNQLPASREVVEALRADTGVTLFARGADINAPQFRDRVKALSRYLAKVTSQDAVPIAALPSSQLDADTIEVLATH